MKFQFSTVKSELHTVLNYTVKKGEDITTFRYILRSTLTQYAFSSYSEDNKVYHPIQRNTTIQFKVPTNHDAIPWDSDTLDTFKKLHVTCIHVRWDQKDAKSSRLLCILRNPKDVQTPNITGNYLSEALILASQTNSFFVNIVNEIFDQHGA